MTAPLRFALTLAATLCLAACGPDAWDEVSGPGEPPVTDDDDATDDELATDDDDAADDATDDDDAADEELDADGDGVPWPEDCWDGDASVFPGAPELCDGLDNDCSGTIDDVPDADGDGADACSDCDDDEPDVRPGLAETCGDGLDNDCSGEVDEAIDADADGSSLCDGDCDDDDPSVFPGATGDDGGDEADGLDEDCDGSVDEGYDAPAVQPEAWLMSQPIVELLTGWVGIDAELGGLLTSMTPPQADDVVVMLSPATGLSVPGFVAMAGTGEATGAGYAWDDLGPTTVWCDRLAAAMECEPVASLVIPIEVVSEELVLRDVVFSGTFAADDTLLTGTLQAVMRSDEVPAIQMPSGWLEELMLDRAPDADSDGDGALDAWTVTFHFSPYIP